MDSTNVQPRKYRKSLQICLKKGLHHLPKHVLSPKLKGPTGKAKKCMFEQLDTNLYEAEARMVAFRVTRSRLRPWIGALSIYYYEYLGENVEFDIDWNDDPLSINQSKKELLKTITIEVNITKSQVENPLLYKITLFASTGPIQAQGKEYDKFVSKVFPLLLKSVDFICGDPELQPKDSQSENPSNKPGKEQTAVKSVDTEVKNKDCQSENPSNKPEKEQHCSWERY